MPELRARIDAERRWLFRVRDPELIGGLVEDVFDLALVLVLVDHRGLVDDLQFPPGVAQALSQGREVAVDRGPPDLAQSPELEALDDRFIDAVEREFAHRLKFEQLLVVALIELDGSGLSGMLGVDPDVKLRLKLLECRYLGLLLLDDSDLLLDQLKPVGGRVIESLALVLETGRFDMCLAAEIEVEIVVRTSGTLEDTDFMSEYPTVAALMDLMEILRAKKLTFEDATNDVQSLIESMSLHRCFKRRQWRDFRFFVLVEPAGDVFPVRTMHSGFTQSVGNDYLTDKKPIWMAGPDVINSVLQTDRAPRVLRAIRIVPHALVATAPR